MRATQHQPTVLIFKEFNIGRSKGIRYFERVNGSITNTPFTNSFKLSYDRGFAKVKTRYWLTVKGVKIYEKNNLTGLFPPTANIKFYGDNKVNGKKESLILFKFTESTTLKILFYNGYYPDKDTIKELLKNI